MKLSAKIFVSASLLAAGVISPTVSQVAQARCTGTTASNVTNNGSTEAARPGTCDGSNTYSGAYRRSSGSEQVYIKYTGYNVNFGTNLTTSSSFQNANLVVDTNSSGFIQNCYLATVTDVCSATVVNSGF